MSRLCIASSRRSISRRSSTRGGISGSDGVDMQSSALASPQASLGLISAGLPESKENVGHPARASYLSPSAVAFSESRCRLPAVEVSCLQSWVEMAEAVFSVEVDPAGRAHEADNSRSLLARLGREQPL